MVCPKFETKNYSRFLFGDDGVVSTKAACRGNYPFIKTAPFYRPLLQNYYKRYYQTFRLITVLKVIRPPSFHITILLECWSECLPQLAPSGDASVGALLPPIVLSAAC